ncbi:MAG: DMT family transporter [Cellvibrionaceae bacterium]|nr:DMT family transporter [Cellvibrionaceae bacterium]
MKAVYSIFVDRQYLGVRYMILSALGFSCMGAFVKLSSAQGIPLLEIVAARALVSLVLSYGEIKRQRLSWCGQRRGLLLARGAVGTLALICVYYALAKLTFAEATVLQYLHPVFTALLAMFFLSEPVRPATLLSVLCSFSGLILIVRPAFLFSAGAADYDYFTVTIAVLGAAGSALAYVLVRKLNETEAPAVIILYFPLVALPVSLILLGDDFLVPTVWQCLLLLMVGVTTQIGQVGLTRALQTETAGRATSFSYLQVVFAAIIGYCFFEEVLDLWIYIGGAMILLGAFISAAGGKKSIAQKPSVKH